MHESKCLKAIRQKCAAYIESGIVNGGTGDEEGTIDEIKNLALSVIAHQQYEGFFHADQRTTQCYKLYAKYRI